MSTPRHAFDLILPETVKCRGLECTAAQAKIEVRRADALNCEARNLWRFAAAPQNAVPALFNYDSRTHRCSLQA